MSTIAELALEPCESFVGPEFGGTMTCMSENSGKHPDARYLSERHCWPCRIRAALASPPTDAEAEAALDAYWKSGHNAREHMRAALEAARAVR